MVYTLRTTAYARLVFLLLLTYLINSTTAATLASISSAASNLHSQSYPDSEPAQNLEDAQFPINFPVNPEDMISHHYSSSSGNDNDKKYLHITAVLPHPNTTTNCPSSDLNSSSDLPAVFICLRSPSPFTPYPTLGTSVPLPLPLSKTRNTTLVVLPPGSSEGWHRPPGDGMVFVLLRGVAVVRDYEPWESSSIAGRGGRCGEWGGGWGEGEGEGEERRIAAEELSQRDRASARRGGAGRSRAERAAEQQETRARARARPQSAPASAIHNTQQDQQSHQGVLSNAPRTLPDPMNLPIDAENGERQDGVESTSRPKHEFTVKPAGPNQFLLALDTTGKGHWTDYPSDEETWALQIPLEEGREEIIQGWEAVGEGACQGVDDEHGQ